MGLMRNIQTMRSGGSTVKSLIRGVSANLRNRQSIALNRHGRSEKYIVLAAFEGNIEVDGQWKDTSRLSVRFQGWHGGWSHKSSPGALKKPLLYEYWAYLSYARKSRFLIADLSVQVLFRQHGAGQVCNEMN